MIKGLRDIHILSTKVGDYRDEDAHDGITARGMLVLIAIESLVFCAWILAAWKVGLIMA